MKKVIYIIFVCLFVTTGLASYTYEVYVYGDNKTLYNEETILVDLQGGMDGLTLRGSSTADILGTSELVEGSGGIWYLDLFDSSDLNMSAGGVHEINPHNDATVFLSGGIIQRIKSSQNAWAYDNSDPPVLVPNPHITIECLDYFHNTSTNLLTGHWFDDGAAFSIQLVNVSGYSPAMQNIQFVPEPATLALLGFGGLLIRRRK